jgi:hypothetical protein
MVNLDYFNFGLVYQCSGQVSKFYLPLSLVSMSQVTLYI